MSSKSHQYAISVEWDLCNIFKCERFGFGGIVNSDFLDRNMYAGMACALATFYLSVPNEKQKQIDEFLNKYGFYIDKSTENLIDEFGEKEVKAMIKEFNELTKKLK